VNTVQLKRRLRLAAWGVIAVAAVTFFCYHAPFDLASSIPVYMLLIVIQALTGDLPSTALVSLLSAGCLDFFFTEPRFTLYISNPVEVLTVLVFFFISLVITELVSRQREIAKASVTQKDRLARLYDLSRRLLALNPDIEMGSTFLEPFQELFGITAICAFDAATAELHSVGISQHQLANKTREAYISGHNIEYAKERVSVHCLKGAAGGRITGAVGFEGAPDSMETIGSLTVLVAMLAQRTKAFREASVAAAAAQTEAYRGAVLDALAHEFKTPLATILAAAGAIRDSGNLTSSQDEMAVTLEEETVHLSDLTSRLLRTARLEKADIRPRLETVDISVLAATLAREYAARFSDRHIRFVPPGQSPEIGADPELLRLALNQLVENACKYSLPDSNIEINIQREGGGVAIRVSNDGSTVPYRERQRIFDRFYRGSNATRAISGSGLGLYVARKIADAHGGSLELESQMPSKQWVTFCLRIPFHKEAQRHVLTAQ
jgi:two-component system sensor histidine kinase KdpD